MTVVVAARRRATSARALRRRTDPCSKVAAPSSRLRLRCETSCLALRLRTEPWSSVAALSSRFWRFCATSTRAVRLLSEFCSSVAAELIWRLWATSRRAVLRLSEFWSSVAAASRSSSTKRTLRSSAGMAPSSSDSDMSSNPPSCTASKISWGGCVYTVWSLSSTSSNFGVVDAYQAGFARLLASLILRAFAALCCWIARSSRAPT